MTPAESRSEKAASFRIEYPENLPVSAHVDELRDLWLRHRKLIVCGETGSGKTTQLPKIALQCSCGRNGMIGCTQPRRIAATAMARRLAQELNTDYGSGVGSQVRFEDRTKPETVLKFMTDGVLLAELRNDPLLRKYDCIIIDEAHERTLNIDFLLGVLKNLLSRRHDLFVAISSATLDAGKLAAFFDDAPVVNIEGRTYPVEDIFLEPFADEELPEHVARAVQELAGFDPRGDILVFLPGEREIRECSEMLNGRNYRNTEILPLYSRLSSADQQKVFHPGNLRRIILSTNVAETSLTIPRIKFCIDSGLARISRYNPRSRIQELQIEMISRSSAGQRRGRCGRTADGICVHLYSEEELSRADEYTDPEIKRTSLAGVILQMASLHLPDIRVFPFLDPPSGALIREGFRTLTDIRAMNEYGHVLPEGRKIARLPLDPHLGRMLLAAEPLKALPEVLILCAGLSIAEVKERPAEKPQAADQAHAVWKDERSDFIAMLNLWNDASTSGAFNSNGMLRKFCRRNFLNFTRMREWKNLVADLAEAVNFHGEITTANTDIYDAIHEALLCGIPRNIARLDSETKQYRGTDGKKFLLFPGSHLAKCKRLPEWVVCFALMETSRVFGRVAAAVAPEMLLRCAPHLCARSYDQEHFESASGFVRAREKVSLGSLLLHAGRRVDFAKHNPVAAREIFIREGLLTGSVRNGGSAVDKFNALRERLLEYELRMRKAGFLYDEERAAEYFFTTLPPEAVSAPALKELTRQNPGLLAVKAADFTAEEYLFDPDDYPDKMEFGGVKFRLQYTFEPGESNDGAMLCVPESEINLLPDTALAYPVPGYYADFGEVLLRALPKESRRNLGGIPQCAGLFAAELKRDPALRELPPGEVLADILRDALEIEVNPRTFDGVKLPEYLQLKLGILNASGRLKNMVRELPDRSKRSTFLSAALPGTESHRATGWTQWDAASGAILEKVELPRNSGRFFYPALTVENQGQSVGKQLYLKLPEAQQNHRRAVGTLFMLTYAPLVKMIRKGLKFSNELRLSLLVGADTAEFEKELILAALAEVSPVDMWQIRTAAGFEQWAESVKPDLSETVEFLAAELERFTGDYTVIRNFSRRAGGAGEEISRRLRWLFAPGFLKRPAVCNNYRRYMKALKLRAQRAADAPGKDAAKAETLALWESRFAAAVNTVTDIADSPGLYEFWELLEECHIAVFAPEVKVAVKSPLAKLETCWEQLRI